MSIARQILPNATYQISRRCAHREFRLLPSAVVLQIVAYCVAEAALRYDVSIHAVMVMSNHIHMVVTDRSAHCPEFTTRVHRHIANCMNAVFGWTENFWSTAKTSMVRLEDTDAVLRKLVYTLVNPVAAGLVEKVTDWPGFHTAGIPFGSSRTFDRPKGYFRKNGPLPETATLVIEKPPALADMSDEECTACVERAVREEEEAIQGRMRAEGRKFRGPKRCCEGRRTDRPAHEEEEDLRLSPTFATLDRELRKAALERRRAFVAEYREAYKRWKAGDRDVEFPPGTYWLRVHAGVRCRAPT